MNFRGEKRPNETHESKTDPDSLLARKSAGKESRLSYSGNLLVENLNGLIVDAEVFQANGTAERDAALVMMERLPGTKPLTVGGDKGFDTFGFVEECRHLRVTPHVAQNLGRRGGRAIDGRTTRHSGYAISQKRRKRIEECFGWLSLGGERDVSRCAAVQLGTKTKVPIAHSSDLSSLLFGQRSRAPRKATVPATASPAQSTDGPRGRTWCRIAARVA